MFEEILITNELVTLSVKEFMIRLAVSIGIGLVIGLEREHAGMRDNQNHFAGIRTFTIVTLLGFLSGILAGFLGLWIVYLSFAGLIILVAVSYYTSSLKGDVGATTEFALIASYLLGLIVFLGYIQISLAITVIILSLLSLKVEMKTLAGKTTREEIFALLKFIVLIALILPFLPNETIDPYEVFNPREVMFIIILASGLNFSGYLLIKFLGANKGILLTGALGGFVSSTIITWTFSKSSSQSPILSRQYASAILFASSIMPLRMMVWVYIFNKSLLPQISLPMLLLVLTGFAYAWLLMRKNFGEISDENILPDNPLNLIEALKFAALFTFILYIVHFAVAYLGSKGMLLVSAIAALTDVDAITISLAKISDPSITAVMVANGILLAVLSNTVVKLGIALAYGSKELKKNVAVGFGLVFLAGIIGFVIINV